MVRLQSGATAFLALLVWTNAAPAGKTASMSAPPQRKIVAFHQDPHGDWVADLECGHMQHVRHNPPWQSRPWVITTEGRSAQLGKELPCKKCAKEISSGLSAASA